MGGQFELKDGATKKYYSIAGMTVATQDASGLQYLLTDHLGSTVAVTNASGTLTSQSRYLPFGGVRSIPNSPILATDFGYTGQRLLDAGMGGIMDYKARFYSPYLNRFTQPDTVIPRAKNPQDWNRYSYAYNNPIKYNDPDGHCPICATAVIGAAIGAIVGAVGYTAYVAATGKEFNSKHFWMATGGGAVAGALIGTGVGVAQGLTAAGATTAAIEAGTAATTANAACGGDMCASEVQDASRVIQNSVPATQKIVTVLGRYPANRDLAKSIGGNWLNTLTSVWDKMSPAQQWERNKAWLQEAIIRGDVFRLASKITEATKGSGFRQELDYMFNVAKYTIDRSGQYLIGPK